MHSVSRSLLNCSSKHYQYAEEIAAFLHQNPQRALSDKKLYRILNLYEKWWIFVGRFSSEPFERYVLHYIAERAFWSDIKDGEYIAKLLVFLYQADNHFGFFLCPEVNCYPALVSFSDSTNHFAQFYLNHAYRHQLTISGRRIVDVEVFCRSIWLHPCEMAVITESPTMLHLLLRYGALITDETVSLRRFRSYPASGNVMIIALCVMKTIVEVFHSELRDSSVEIDNTKYTDMVQCGKLIIRACPQLEKSFMQQLSIGFFGFRSAEEALNWVSENAVPELRYRIFLPMSLKHACRLKIRKLLHNNWQLPYGIKELFLPQILQKFLDLDFD